jgi:hypothetical protein
MNNDDQFEQRLRRQPVKPIPSAWRQEILAATEHACAAGHASRITHHALLSTINHQLSTLLWPHPKAWAGLAAVWLVIFAVNFATADKTIVTAGASPPSSIDLLRGLRPHEQLLAELNGRPDAPEADRPKSVPPRPHSQRREEILTA